jgi:Cdc6-like AAA superfamily ATPase
VALSVFPDTLVHEQRRIQNWLKPSDLRAITYYKDNYNTAKKAMTKTTCRWLHSETLFLEWLSEKGPNALWICGDPGTGKTILAASTIDYIEDLITDHDVGQDAKSDKPVLLYFFCDSKSNDECKYKSRYVVRALLYQLWISTKERTGEQFVDLWQRVAREIESDSSDYATVMGQIVCLISKLYVVIDALDECGDRGTLLSEIASVMEKAKDSNTRIKIIITTRPNKDFEHTFEGQTTISVTSRRTEADMNTVIEASVDAAINQKLIKIRSQDLRDEIICVLKEGANGM